MPIISIKMAQGRSLEKKQALAAAITRDVAEILEVQPDWVTIVIDEYPRENWATAGELHSVKYGIGHGQEDTEYADHLVDDSFQALMHYFKSLPWDEITLTYGDIEDIIDQSLPYLAREQASWWTNDKNSGMLHAVQGWLAAGWQVVEVTLDKQVSFRRVK